MAVATYNFALVPCPGPGGDVRSDYFFDTSVHLPSYICETFPSQRSADLFRGDFFFAPGARATTFLPSVLPATYNRRNRVFISDGTKLIPYSGPQRQTVTRFESLEESLGASDALTSLYDYGDNNPNLLWVGADFAGDSWSDFISGTKLITTPGMSLPTVVRGGLNDKDYISFDSGQSLFTESFPLSFSSGEFTIFAVMRIRTIVLCDGVLSFSPVGDSDFSSANGFSLEKCSTTSKSLRCTHRAGDTFEYEMSFPNNAWGLFTWLRSHDLGYVRAFLGVNTSSYIGTQSFSGTASISPSRFAINGRGTSSGYSYCSSAMDLAELSIFNRALNLNDVSAIQSIIASRFNLS